MFEMDSNVGVEVLGLILMKVRAMRSGFSVTHHACHGFMLNILLLPLVDRVTSRTAGFRR